MTVSALAFLIPFLVFCLILLGVSFTYSAIARELPLLILTLTLLFVILEMFQSFRKKPDSKTLPEVKLRKKRFRLTLISTVFYLGAIPVLGYLISTGIYLLALMFLLGTRNRLYLILSTAGMLLFIWGVFFQWLKVQSPVH